MNSTDNPLALQLSQNQVSESDALVLKTTFTPFFEQAEQWRATAQAIQVTSPDDKEQIKAARESRLALKEIRVGVEKRRKELKEDSLRKGKAIDAVANFIKSIIEPLEDHLQKQEDFVRIQEELRLQKKKESRATELSQYGVNLELYDLGTMTDENYAQLLASSKQASEAAKAAAQKQEQDRIEKEKADAAERERLRVENERLRQIDIQNQKKLETERKERQRLETEAKAKRDEEERLKIEEQKRQHKERVAPDRDKLVAFADRIASVQVPEVSSDEAKAVIKQAITLLSKASEYVKSQSINL